MAVEEDGVAGVSVSHNATYGNIRFGEEFEQLTESKVGSRVLAEPDEDGMRICLLPELSEEIGIKVHQAGVRKAASSIVFREIPIGRYQLIDTDFDGELEWFIMTRIEDED